MRLTFILPHSTQHTAHSTQTSQHTNRGLSVLGLITKRPKKLGAAPAAATAAFPPAESMA